MEEKHDIPFLHDWEANVEKDNWINVKIDESLDIEGAKIKFLGDQRQNLLEMKVNSRDIHISLPIGNPLFVELHTKGGVTVKYVEGSGKKLYDNYKKEQ